MSYTSFCQNVTQKIQSDSLIVLPKYIVRSMVEDIVLSDSYADEIILLTKTLDKKQEIIYKQDTLIGTYREKMGYYQKEISKYTDLVNEKEFEVLNLNKQVTKEHKKYNTAKVIAASLLVGLIVNHYSWKGAFDN